MQSATLRAAFQSLPVSLRDRVSPEMEAWLRTRVVPWLTGSGPVAGIEARLWGGFSRSSLAALGALAADPDARPGEAAAAGLALARWHGAAGDPVAALACLRAAVRRSPTLARQRQVWLPEALFLCQTGDRAAARALVQARARGFDASARLMRANCADTPDGILAEVNGLLTHVGLAPLAVRDPARAFGLDNLAAPASASGMDAATVQAGPLVTVIVPAYNAAATLATALASLCAQSHGRLEILVVDDASTDDTAAVAARLAAGDPRIRLLRQSENRGAYVARNRALAEAQGAFVTVQDADDWSHPQRIARHLADLEASGQPFNLSDWARVTPDLRFWGTWRPGPNLVSPNFASLFFRRSLVERCGPWDTARVSADREFADRLARLLGTAPARAFLPGAPLAFGRSEAGSLTRSGLTHAATLYHGVRRDYREAAAVAHDTLPPAAWRAAAGPPFVAAPWSIRSIRPAVTHDLLFLADFNLRGGTYHSAVNMIRAARTAGLDCAALHYRRFDLEPGRPLDPRFRRLAAEAGLRLVSPGERLRARAVVVTYPAIFHEAMDRFPDVEHDRLAVVVNQMAERDLAGTARAYDPGRVRGHLAELLGGEGAWLPISARVRALMAADPRYPAPAADTWTPLLDLAAWPVTARWRGGDAGARPVLGRHGRDDALKWPRDPDALAAAFCADRPCAVRFLGGARHARARLRRWPRNWSVEAFDAREARDFLADLDVFLHFPDGDYVEEFGRAAMEAMASGVPVILPPEFAPTFGDAAIYADPVGVWPLVEDLWQNRAAWEARSAAGRAFVEENCGYDRFPDRLSRLFG